MLPTISCDIRSQEEKTASHPKDRAGAQVQIWEGEAEKLKAGHTRSVKEM